MNKKFLKLIELMVDQKLKEQKPPSVNEGGRTFATEALREVMDDLLMASEMLIDGKYGQVDIDDFKKMWYKAISGYEKKFSSILKNMGK